MTRVARFASGVLLAAAASSVRGTAARAQAPIITPAGDPSVRADTIYRLAVDPKAYPQEQVHWLLDDGVIRVGRNGHISRTYRSVRQILTEQGAESEREREYSYTPGRQRFRINWVRVVRPDGTVVSAAPTHEQESDVAPPLSADPVYGETKVIRMSLSGVAPGTIVDASYTEEDTLPAMPGDFYDAWAVTPGVRVERSRYIVDVPSSLHVHIQERNLSFHRSEHTVNGRTTYMWATRDVAKFDPEPFAADSTNTVIQTVTVGAPIAWGDVAHWYAGLARDRYATTPMLARKVAELTRGARTRDDSIRAIHRWVAQDVRYVGIELGRGGYQPRMPDSVVAAGYGDCKDKATLFVAALHAAGITAYPVILSAFRTASPAFPGVEQFNHEIAVVPGPGGTRTYTDLTAAYFPYGVLPESEGGGFALVVHPDGTSEEVTLPRAGVSADHTIERVTGVLSADGTFTGVHETRLTGPAGNGLRTMFANPLDSAMRATLATAMVRRDFSTAHGDTLIAFNGKDFSQPIAMTVRFSATDVTTPAGPLLLLNLPFQGPGKPNPELVRQLTQTPRRFPIDIGQVSPAGVTDVEFRVTLPEGWKAQLPPDVVIPPGPFGSYETHYSQQGRDLIVSKRRVGARGILPPNRIHDVLAWFEAMGKDDAKFVVLQRPAATTAGK